MVYHTEDGRNHIYLFESYNFTLKIHWAPYLVRVEDKLFTWPDSNVTEMVTHVYLDELAEAWVKAAVGADILHLSAGEHSLSLHKHFGREFYPKHSLTLQQKTSFLLLPSHSAYLARWCSPSIQSM